MALSVNHNQSVVKAKNQFEIFFSVHGTTHGEPECEELCRNEEKCVGFNFIRSKCFLKSSLVTELKWKMSISGKKFQPDYNGDPLKGTVESSFIRYMIGQELSTNEKLIYVKSI